MSLGIIADEVRRIAEERLSALGLVVTYGRHVLETGPGNTASVAVRVADFHDAFSDPDVSGVLTAIGGCAANQMLPHLDYELIAANPKPLCGYSDITALNAALLARAGLVTFSGPTLFDLGMLEGAEYMLNHFEKSLFRPGSFTLTAATEWSDDSWRTDQHNRNFFPNPGPRILQCGRSAGRLVGGSLSTFSLLRGTPFFPDLGGSILVLEDDASAGNETLIHVERNLFALSQVPGFADIAGIVFGRFARRSAVNPDDLDRILSAISSLARNPIPVIADVDVGHTCPMTTWPYGGMAHFVASHDRHISLFSDGSDPEPN